MCSSDLMKQKDLCYRWNQVQDLALTVSWEREYQSLPGRINHSVHTDKVKGKGKDKGKIGIREVVDMSVQKVYREK